MPPIKSAGEFLGRFSSISENDRKVRGTFFLFLVVIMSSCDGQCNGSYLGSMKVRQPEKGASPLRMVEQMVENLDSW